MVAVLEKKLSEVKNDSWAGYHLPDNEDDKNFMINYLLNSLFKLSEVEKTIKHREHADALRASEITGTEPDFEDFIRNLKVFFENDNEVKIQEPGKKTKPYTCESLGFRDNTTKEWKEFVRILQDPPHTYSIGSSYTEKDRGIRVPVSAYSSRRKLLIEIDKKLKDFFAKEYKKHIPKGIKTYELFPKEGEGVYRFKFQVESDEEEVVLESKKDQYIKKLEKLCDEYRKTQNGTISEKITTISRIVLEKGWKTNDDIRDMLKPDID